MVTMNVKALFFDSDRVMQAMDAATRRALSKAGAFIRTRARSSIRKRKGTSRPGRPPHSHAGHLKRLLFFAYDPDAETVVIGPTKFAKGEAPSLLEFGGRTVRVTRHESGRPGRRRAMVYRKRPFMGPAMEAELPGLPKHWRNSIGG